MAGRRIPLWQEVSLALSLCILEIGFSTGVSLHEWLGVAVSALALWHLLAHWTWVTSWARRALRSDDARGRVNFLVNLGLFASLVVALFSGAMLSEVIGPALGRPSDWHWHGMHDTSARLVLVFAGLHVAINWDRIVGALRSRSRLPADALPAPAIITSPRRLAPALARMAFATCLVLAAAGAVSGGAFLYGRAFPEEIIIGGRAPAGVPIANAAQPDPLRRMDREGRPLRPSLPRSLRIGAVYLTMLAMVAWVGRRVLRLRLTG